MDDQPERPTPEEARRRIGILRGRIMEAADTILCLQERIAQYQNDVLDLQALIAESEDTK